MTDGLLYKAAQDFKRIGHSFIHSHYIDKAVTDTVTFRVIDNSNTTTTIAGGQTRATCHIHYL